MFASLRRRIVISKSEGEAGRFRPDLFYRLSVIQIDIPPLRERGDDVRLLAEHYMSTFRKRLRKNIDRISPEALAAFASYEWPGNVRELRNVIERAMILEDGDEITAKYLPRGLAVESRTGSATLPSDQMRLPAEASRWKTLRCLWSVKRWSGVVEIKRKPPSYCTFPATSFAIV